MNEVYKITTNLAAHQPVIVVAAGIADAVDVYREQYPESVIDKIERIDVFKVFVSVKCRAEQ